MMENIVLLYPREATIWMKAPALFAVLSVTKYAQRAV